MDRIHIPIKLDDKTLEVFKKMFLEVLVNAMEEIEVREDNTKQVFNKKGACDYLDVSFNTLQKLIRSGLPVVNVDGLQLIRKIDIDNFLEENRI